MAISQQDRERLAQQVEGEQARRRAREEDICDYAGRNFYVPETSMPIELLPHQRWLRICFTRGRILWEDGTPKRDPNADLRNDPFPFTTILRSTIKKSGKSTEASIPMLYMAQTQTRMGEIYAIGNDQEQAKGRSFKFAANSIRLTPGCQQKAGAWILPNKWAVHKTYIECYTTGTEIKAISVDARGEAGGNPDLTVWTELWGFEYEDALRFWDEMTQSPTKQNSIRLVETYAGYEGESNLLEGLYRAGLTGHQLTNHEFASLVGRPGVEGDEYKDILEGAFVELNGDPEGLIPVYMNEAAGLFMFWDEGNVARRMPWQLGEAGKKYYREQAATIPPAAYERFHENHWVSAESQFVPLELWDACAEDLPAFRPVAEGGDKTQVVLAVDAATTGDCFGVVAVTRHPDPKRQGAEVAVRAVKRWDPKEEGGRIDYSECEKWIKVICAAYNVVQICYDPYQLEDMMQRLRKEGVAWVEPFSQGQDRLTSDRRLYDLIVSRKLAWAKDGMGMDHLREHVQNANVKLQKDEDSKMRIVKKAANRKIDLTVALSMAADRCLYLLLG